MCGVASSISSQYKYNQMGYDGHDARNVVSKKYTLFCEVIVLYTNESLIVLLNQVCELGSECL